MNFWRHCWQCDHDTKHEIISSQFYPRVVEMFSKNETGKVKNRVWAVFIDAFLFTKCEKCAAPSLFVDEYWTTSTEPGELIKIKEEVNNNGISKSGNFIHTLRYPGFSKEPFPQWTHDLEETYMKLFWEVYQAVSLNLHTLAMMGIRCIIDKYAIDKIGDIGNFRQKLTKLKEQNFINNNQYKLLEIVIEAGNAAAHRAYSPPPEHVSECLKIIEHLVSIDKYGDSIEKIRQKIPNRKPSLN